MPVPEKYIDQHGYEIFPTEHILEELSECKAILNTLKINHMGRTETALTEVSDRLDSLYNRILSNNWEAIV